MTNESRRVTPHISNERKSKKRVGIREKGEEKGPRVEENGNANRVVVVETDGVGEE